MMELKNSKTTYLGKKDGKNSFALDCFIGAVQMRDPGGDWQDIKPHLVPDAEGWHIEGTPYYAEVKKDGARLFCPDRNERGKYLRLPTFPLVSRLAKNIISTPTKLDWQVLPNIVRMPTPWGYVEFIFTNTGIQFQVYFREAPPSVLFGEDSSRILLDIDSAGLDIAGLLTATSGLGIPRPRLIENAEIPQERQLDWLFKDGQLELGFDLTGLKFPVLLKNNTIDDQVDTGTDDGYAGGAYLATGTKLYVGTIGGTAYHAWALFGTISGLSGVTIGANTYYSIYVPSGTGAVLTKVMAEDVASSTYPTNTADYNSRTPTTAQIDWDGSWTGLAWNNLLIPTIIQELANSYDPSSILILHKDDGNAGSVYLGYSSYEVTGNVSGPKLHIEYEAAAGGQQLFTLINEMGY